MNQNHQVFFIEINKNMATLYWIFEVKKHGFFN